MISGSPALRNAPRPRRDSMSFPIGLSKMFEIEALKGKLCGSQMVTSLGSASGLFDGSRRMMWSFPPCRRIAPTLTRPSKICSRDGTILTSIRSSNTRSSYETRVLSSTRKTLHSCLVEHGKTGDPQNQFLMDGALLGSPLQDWIHMKFPTLNLWPPRPRIQEALCPLRIQWHCYLPLQWEAQGKAAGRPPYSVRLLPLGIKQPC